jgi:hypothetical protein
MQLAVEKGCKSVAFPLISSGIYGYPKAEALRVAVDTITGFLTNIEHDIDVYIVVFDKKAFKISDKLFNDVAQFIDDNYVDEHQRLYPEYRRRIELNKMDSVDAAPPPPMPASMPCEASPFSASSVEEAVSMLDESFSEMLLRKIDEKGMTDAQCYKKANIDRKLFSKIRSNPLYRPGKTTAVAFAIALELSLKETEELLKKAGFALSHSNKFDIIIEFFIQKGNYNIYEINEALFAFDQCLLGA